MKKIQILGTGCPKCRKLTENAELAVKAAGVECEIEKVADITKILDFGVMITPALVVNGEVKASGKVLRPEEIEQYL